MEDKNSYARIAGYSLQYKNLKLKLHQEFPYVYELGIIIALAKELDQGFKAKRIGKANSRYTKVTYEPILKKEVLKKYYDEITMRLKDLQKEEAVKEISKFFREDYKKIMSNRWTKEEINFLKENYWEIGAEPIAKKFNRTKNAVWKKASNLKLSYTMKTHYIEGPFRTAVCPICNRKLAISKFPARLAGICCKQCRKEGKYTNA